MHLEAATLRSVTTVSSASDRSGTYWSTMNSSMVAQDVISKFVDHGFGHLALNYATTILAALGAWLWCYRWFQRNTTGPKAWPLVGALPEIQRNWGNLHEYLTGFFSESTRTIILPLGGSTGVLTADPESVEYILQTNFSNYPKVSQPNSCNALWILCPLI